MTREVGRHARPRSRGRGRLRWLAAIAAALVCAGALAADPVFPPGSRIGLVPPPEMVPSDGIAGFRDPKTGAALATIEMPAEAYPSLAATFADEALKAQGFTLKSRDTLKIGEAEALIVSGVQDQAGVAVPKSVLLAPAPGMTVLVIAQSPPGSAVAESDRLRDALKTVVVRAPLSVEQQLAALPFRLGDLAGFRPLRAMAGNSVMLTLGPSDAIRDAEQPVLIIAHAAMPPAPPEQRDAMARSLVLSNTFLRETIFERAQGFRQGGAEWHEIVAKAKDGRSGAPVVALQTLRFASGSYLRMVGVVKAEQRDAVMPLFRRIVDTVMPR